MSDNIFREWTGAGLLKFRLKWGETQSERALATHFLRQIMMMSAAELVAEGTDPLAIDWRFSYPQAFKRRSIASWRMSCAVTGHPCSARPATPPPTAARPSCARPRGPRPPMSS